MIIPSHTEAMILAKFKKILRAVNWSHATSEGFFGFDEDDEWKGYGLCRVHSTLGHITLTWSEAYELNYRKSDGLIESVKRTGGWLDGRLSLSGIVVFDDNGNVIEEAELSQLLPAAFKAVDCSIIAEP